MADDAEQSAAVRSDCHRSRLDRQRERVIVAAAYTLQNVKSAVTIGTTDTNVVTLGDLSDTRLKFLPFRSGFAEAGRANDRCLHAFPAALFQYLSCQPGVDHQHRDIGSFRQVHHRRVTSQPTDLRSAWIDRIDFSGEFRIDKIT